MARQNDAIKRCLSKQESRTIIEDLLSKLKRIDPVKGKEQLLKAVKGLNTNFNINYPLTPRNTIPKRRLKRKVSISEDDYDIF